MSALLREVDDGIRAELVEAVGRHRYRLWFRDTEVSNVSEDELVIAVPTEVHRTWLQYTYGELLDRACERVLGPGVRVCLEVNVDQNRKRQLRDRLPERPEDWKALLGARVPAPSLESYATEPSGRFPVMLLRQLLGGTGVEDPPTIYLFGPTGCGKTHLLRGLERGVARRSPGDALYVTVRQFTQRYVAALRGRDAHALRVFRADLTSRRLVILDGIEELAGRKSTQQALVALHDDVIGTTTRIVMAGDQHPSELDGLRDQLRSRLLGGVVIRLPLARGERLERILKGRALAIGVELPDDTCDAILERTASVHGAVDLVDRWACVSAEIGRPLEPDWLSELAPGAAASASQEVIRRTKELVARHFGIRRELLDRPTKIRNAAIPRRMAMYLVYRACAMPLVKLGEAFGLKSHSSVSRAIRDIRELREMNVEVEQTIDGLLAQI